MVRLYACWRACDGRVLEPLAEGTGCSDIRSERVRTRAIQPLCLQPDKVLASSLMQCPALSVTEPGCMCCCSICCTLQRMCGLALLP